MKFGIREICDVVFKAKTSGSMGSMQYVPGQPVLYIDTAKTSTVEGAATTVYATGGRGNARLIAWEGEKTLTFTIEDALLSPIGMAILTGAGLMDAKEGAPIYVHVSAMSYTGNGTLDLVAADIINEGETVSATSPIFVMKVEDGSIVGKLDASIEGNVLTITDGVDEDDKPILVTNSDVYVDFYIEKKSAAQELTIDMKNFAGYFYVEASTLFKSQTTGKEIPAELVFPNVKVQSNFTFSMAATGDPSTFTFTMDAMPGYTRFDRSKKVLCAIQLIEDGNTQEDIGADSKGNDAGVDLLYPLA